MSTFALLRQSLRMLGRDWRSGDLRLLCAALVVAVAAVTSVGFFVDRVRAGLQRDAAQYLGGDAVIESDRPLDPAWREDARRLGLQDALAASFPSMALADGGAATLVSVKAVWPGYPLRGRLRIRDAAGVLAERGGPDAGTVFVDAAVLDGLRLKPGDPVQVGDLHLRVAGVIEREPDRSLQVIGFAPRLMMAGEDLAATHLVQPASRVAYRAAVAGAPPAVRNFVQARRSGLQRGQRIESLDDDRPEFQRTLGRADRFLGLAALVTVLIAAVAVRSAARRYSLRRLDTCALLRCLGLRQREMALLFAIEFVLIGLAASAAGVAAGLGLHEVLLRLLASTLSVELPAPSLLPVAQGLACGLMVLLGFVLPPLEQLRRVPPLRVLRRDVGIPGTTTVLAYGAGTLGVAGLLAWTAGDLRLAVITAGGFLGCIAAFSGISLLALRGGRRVAHQGTGRSSALGWRYAVAALLRRPVATITQVVSLAMALMALLLLVLVRGDLLEQWRSQAPPDAPNRFVINIQPDQADAVVARLRAAGVDGVQLEPMVRGRLVEIDGRKAGPEDYEDERARNLIEREFNLSYRPDAPAHNRIVEGAWFARGTDELSIEKGIADRLHVHLGQRLRFDVAGQIIEAKVTSVRTVNWDSMRVNFFVILEPHLLRDAPQSLITSFRLPAGGGATVASLVAEFPNLTVIDTEQVLGQLRSVLDQVIAAVQFLFSFAVVAGVLVLVTALSASHDERVREAALLRALGATRAQLVRTQRAELALTGLLSGLLAALGAALVAWALARFAFDFTYVAHPFVLALGAAGGVMASFAGGWPGMRRVLALAPLASLRDA